MHTTVPETSCLSAHPPAARLLPKDAAADRIQSNAAAAAAVVNKLPSVRGHARFRVSLIRKPTHDGQPLRVPSSPTPHAVSKKKFRTSSAAAHRCCGLPGCRYSQQGPPNRWIAACQSLTAIARRVHHGACVSVAERTFQTETCSVVNSKVRTLCLSQSVRPLTAA